MNSFKIRLYRSTAIFREKRILLLLFYGVLVGFCLFGVEVSFAYGFQAFFASLGLMDSSKVTLPSWFPRSGISYTVALIFILGMLRGILQWAQYFLQGAALEEFKFSQRKRILGWVFRSESVSFSQATSLFNERTNSAASAVMSAQSLAIHFTVVTALGFTLFRISPLFTAVALLTLAVLSYPVKKVDSLVRTAGHGLALEWEKTNEKMLTSIKNLLLIQIYGTQDVERKRTQESLAACKKHALVNYHATGLKFALPQILGVGIICVITLVAKSEGRMAPGLLVSYFYIFVRFVQSISELLKTVASLIFYWPQVAELNAWNETQATPAMLLLNSSAKNADVVLTAPVGWDLKQITFKYPDRENPIFEKFNLKITPGEAIVVLGPSGVGKSTLLNLLLGILVPSQGEVVTSSGSHRQDLRTFKESLLPAVGYVGPESFLLAGTVLQNLIYGLESTPTSEEVDAALRASESHFVFDFPQGTGSMITEQGHGLSAGQKQRLCLARALLRKPKALFLDEATANLDNETEARLIATLKKLKGTMTMVIVTHRNALTELADQQIQF